MATHQKAQTVSEGYWTTPPRRSTKYSVLTVILSQVSFLFRRCPQLCAHLPLTGSQPPNLLVTVSGTVTHGNISVPSNSTKSKNVDGQPRVFSQTFILVPDQSAVPAKTGEVAKYYISADAFRFVG